jgi:hypothetical protein
MSTSTSAAQYAIKEPKGLSPRIACSGYFFKGVDRPWNNEFMPWTTGTDWDVHTTRSAITSSPKPTPSSDIPLIVPPDGASVKLHEDFWTWSLPERRAWFVKEVMAATCRTRFSR